MVSLPMVCAWSRSYEAQAISGLLRCQLSCALCSLLAAACPGERVPRRLALHMIPPQCQLQAPLLLWTPIQSLQRCLAASEGNERHALVSLGFPQLASHPH